MQYTRIKRTTKNSRFQTLTAFGFVLLGGMLYFFSEGSIIEFWIRLLSGLCSVYFLYVFIVNARYWLVDRPILVADEWGLQLFPMGITVPKVKWDSIQEVTFVKEDAMLCVALKKQGEDEHTFSRKTKKWMKKNLKNHRVHFCIPKEEIAQDINEVIRSLNTLKKQSKR